MPREDTKCVGYYRFWLEVGNVAEFRVPQLESVGVHKAQKHAWWLPSWTRTQPFLSSFPCFFFHFSNFGQMMWLSFWNGFSESNASCLRHHFWHDGFPGWDLQNHLGNLNTQLPWISKGIVHGGSSDDPSPVCFNLLSYHFLSHFCITFPSAVFLPLFLNLSILLPSFHAQLSHFFCSTSSTCLLSYYWQLLLFLYLSPNASYSPSPFPLLSPLLCFSNPFSHDSRTGSLVPTSLYKWETH